MQFKQEENMIFGALEAQKLCLGTSIVWERNHSFQPFSLDISRFSPENPVLYSRDGRKIAEVSVQYGNLAEKIYVNTDGLHLTGDTRADFPVSLPASGSWTVIYRFKNYALASEAHGHVHLLFSSSGAHLETAFISNWTEKAVHFRLIGTRDGTYQLYHGTQASGYNGFFDYAVPPSDLKYYELEYRWVNDGENLSLYVSGIKKASISLENLTDISDLFITLDNNGFANEDVLTVTHFEVKNSAELSDSVLYRWRLTGFRGSDYYTQIARLCLYDASGNHLETSENALAFALRNGSPADFPNTVQTCRLLTGSRAGTGTCCIIRNGSSQIEIFLSEPSGAPLAAYSYVTGGDLPERDPVSWTFSKSCDGGQTWEELDRQSNAVIPSARNTETSLFLLD